ncbi:cordon-bleu protein-like 1 [Gastrophryne carolinensis]
MDDSGSWSETSSPDATLPSLGKKAKGKAPLPPGEARYSDGDSTLYNMDQKENIARDIELKVVLPGDRITSTIVNGSKPMMDLLVFLCGQYHLNPSTYTMELLSADNSQLKFKPNTPIGMLEVERVVLKSKNLDDRNKKPGPTMPEQTVRLVINYRRTQKTVMRVSPLIPLQELLPSICTKCDFDPQSTFLLHDYQSQKLLDFTKSLNDLGLRELYAMDQSKATSPAEFRLPPLQESPQNAEIKQHDDKGFFHFFRRSTKKKRDQTSSAPATPVLSKSRPPNVTRANTVTQSYDSNTLPSNVPKKRRAPLPPMHSSHNNTNNISRGQFRTSSCVVKSANGDDSEKSVPGFERSRTGSFQHTRSSDFNSSLRRTKRKAPLPPSPPPDPVQTSEENSHETAHVSAEANHVQVDAHAKDLDVTPQAEEMNEPEAQDTEEESSASMKEDENLSSKEETNCLFEETMSASSAVETHAESTDDLATSEIHSFSLTSNVDNISKISDTEEITADCTSSLYSREETANENTTLEYDKIGENENRTSTPTPDLEKIEVQQNKVEVNEQGSQTASREQYTENTNVIFQNNSHITEHETHTHDNLRDVCTEKGKTQDSAVQTVNFDSDWEVTAEKELSHSQEISHLTTVNGVSNNLQKLNGHASLLNEQQVAVSGKQSTQELVSNVKETVCMQTVEENSGEHSLSSQSKPYSFYRQHSDPKPKPSNEITRGYLPKIGMTTFKIVPQRSFDAEQYMAPESPQGVSNFEYRSVNEHINSFTVTNTVDATPPVSDNRESFQEVKNNGHLSHGSVGYSSTMSKTVSEPSQRTHFALSRSVSAAPVLNTEKSIAPEVKPKPKPTSPVKGPSSFYLQMQRRASSMYVTSAIAKTKSSSNVTNNAAKGKDQGNEAPQIAIKTLPARITVENLEKEKLPEEKNMLPEKTKNCHLGAIHEVHLGTENVISASHFSSKTSPNFMHDVSSGSIPEPKKHVTFQETKNLYFETPLQASFLDSAYTIPNLDSADKKVLHHEDQSHVNSTTEKQVLHHEDLSHVDSTTEKQVLHHEHQPLVDSPTEKQVLHHEDQSHVESTTDRQTLHHEDQPRVNSTTTFSAVTQTSSSPTGQSVPLSLQKFRTFVTPRPFSGINPVPFSSVKRSQSFSASTSPTSQPLNVDAPIGWSPVSSPVDLKKDSLVFSSTAEEVTNQTLTPELKYRVHSPPPVPEKKTPVSFPSPDPEQLRQNILAAIRSGEAAASLKRITIRSNTISVNGRSRISHPVFSQSVPEE